jgi:hypothetical protein
MTLLTREGSTTTRISKEPVTEFTMLTSALVWQFSIKLEYSLIIAFVKFISRFIDHFAKEWVEFIYSIILDTILLEASEAVDLFSHSA